MCWADCLLNCPSLGNKSTRRKDGLWVECITRETHLPAPSKGWELTPFTNHLAPFGRSSYIYWYYGWRMATYGWNSNHIPHDTMTPRLGKDKLADVLERWFQGGGLQAGLLIPMLTGGRCWLVNWVVATQRFFIFTPKIGENSHFD